jgi:GH15 family glucan-1,4-alpha-glucosidase
VCGFWVVECLALGGDVQGARDAFDHLLAGANDLDLFAEETDPETGELLGNFPQAFTHVGLINAAVTLTRLINDEEYGDMSLKREAATKEDSQ